ncbi:MAG: hypothetical protein AB4911_02620 [Oscillochloridaceae bacterium umkhey_bin13]
MCNDHATVCLYALNDQETPLTMPRLLQGPRVCAFGLIVDRCDQCISRAQQCGAGTPWLDLTDGAPVPAPPPPPLAAPILPLEAQPIYHALTAWRTARAKLTGQPAALLAPNDVLNLIARQHMSLQVANALGAPQPVPCGWA